MSGGPLVSVVVPVLNEREALPSLLEHLRELPGRWEVIVSDGGSCDGSAEIARAHPMGVHVLDSPAGRARQMNTGADAASGELLVFLHADSRLPSSAYSSLAGAAASGDVLGGNFALRFDGDDRFSRLLGTWYALQRRAGVYYGDSSIWVRANAFRSLGGYRELAVMEDYDFARRLERNGRTVCLPGPALSSPRRWRRLGLPRTIWSWVAIRWLYLAGVSPARLARLYPRIR